MFCFDSSVGLSVFPVFLSPIFSLPWVFLLFLPTSQPVSQQVYPQDADLFCLVFCQPFPDGLRLPLAPTSSAERVHKLITYRPTTMRKWDSALRSLQPQSILENTLWQRRVSFISPQGKGHPQTPLASLYSIWSFSKEDTGLDHVLPPVFPTVRAKLVQVLVASLISCVMLEKPLRLWTSLPKPVRIQPEDLLCTWPQVQSASRSCLSSGN